MEARYTATVTILGDHKRAKPEDPPFTARDLGIKSANIPHLVNRGFLVPYSATEDTSESEEIVDPGNGSESDVEDKTEGSVTLSEGSPWIFDPAEFAESTHVELLALIDTVCEDRGLTPPKFKQRKPDTIKEAALNYLSQDRA